ncbi:MAG: hypothetical protein R2794_03115 [Chitinophagales bacterium]
MHLYYRPALFTTSGKYSGGYAPLTKYCLAIRDMWVRGARSVLLLHGYVLAFASK